MQAPADFDPSLWRELVRLVRANEPDALSAWLQARPAAEQRGALQAHAQDDEDRRTALMLAYWWGCAGSARVLANAGADYLQVDTRGRNAAWYARRFGVGAREASMNVAVETGVRRISMDSVVSEHRKPVAGPRPRRRHKDL